MIQVILVVLVGLLSAVYLYFRHTYKYWLRKGVAQEQPTFLFGNLLDAVLYKKNIGWIYNDLYFKYKDNDAVGFYEFETPKLIVRTPQLFETILIKDFSNFADNDIYADLEEEPFLEFNSFVMHGEKWKPARNSLIKALTNNKLKDMYELMTHTVLHLKNYVDDHLGEEILAQELAQLFMMTNVSSTVYGIESNCFVDPDSMFRKMSHMISSSHWSSWLIVIIVFHMQRLRKFLGLGFIPKKVSLFVEDMLRQVIDHRTKNNINRNDFLNHYLALDKPTEDKTVEAISNCLTFFIAGFDTSSLPSGNLLYELALNPNIQENLYEELKHAFSGKKNLDYNTLTTLPYLDKCFKETLRKHPIAYGAMKLCTNTTTLEIDGKQVEIEKGTAVFCAAFAMHHDPQYYPDPDVFDPERFSEDAQQARHPCTYIPFGAGPRTCAGMKFGILQAKLFLASVVYNYKIEASERTPPKISYNKGSFLPVPVEPQWIRLTKRI